ncbi:MAG: hypothetical protein IPP91_13145 [Betaproteobacteria bacterium]|nr:hypothetical protein [Betaproteobacteria bacterium]
MRPDDALGGFVLRSVLWLPVCFAAWYWSAPLLAFFVGPLARAFVDGFQSGLVTVLEQTGRNLAFVTRITVTASNGEIGFLVPEVDSLLYTYGLALFAALMLAARAKAWMLLVGAVALLPFQAWGVAFDVLVQIGVKAGPDVAGQAGLIGWKREAIALGYQLGGLIFPTLIPVVLWVAFNRPFLENVLGSRAKSLGTGTP